MTVFINGRFTTQPESGVQRYATQILKGLDRIAAAGASFELLCPPASPRLALAHIRQRFIGRGGGHRWEQCDFAWAAKGGAALSLTMSGPLLHRRQLVVIHDAAVHRHPRHFSRRYRWAHRLIEHGLARRATIATVSAFSRDELADVLRLPPAAILVAPNGSDHVVAVEPSDIRDRLRLGAHPYFLTLGNLTANKNLAVVVRALRRLDRPGVRVVAVGAANGRVFGALGLPDDPRLIIAGRLEDRDVRALMAGARALIFPSRYEGFGLPPLEAMASDCPVIAGDCGAVREVCADAADFFDCDDDRALAGLMVTALADDGAWKANRIAAGRRRAARYRWQDSAHIIARACLDLEQSGARACAS